jgi:HTH-type transcriptional regulator, transcriptional repressor of NAD biosynthesis genes
MKKAFVFGKFLPFHRGHEAMIRFALTKCGFLSVLVCCSEKEKISGEKRQHWIRKTFQNVSNIEVEIFNYNEDDLPNTSVSSIEISRLWSAFFKTQYPDYELVVTSEPYGDYIADFMKIEHISFDMKRLNVPISATLIQSNLFENWNYLPDSVKPDFAIKVVILGTESTGKSTLTTQLATHFKCSFVSEAGRDLIADSQHFDFEDLYLVAQEHANRIEKTILGNSPLLIIDTDIHITQSYAQFVFGKKLSINEHILEQNKANLYLYLCNDVLFYQDGTRLKETHRNQLDVSHRSILAENKINFVEISGNWKERFEKSVFEIEKIISLLNVQIP